jgi:hypothetical protein
VRDGNPWEEFMTKDSPQNWMRVGVLSAAAVLSLEIAYIVLQTDPAGDIRIYDATMILMILSIVAFDTAYLEWKQGVTFPADAGLFLIGIAGMILSLQFEGVIGNAFFPRTSISLFLLTDAFMIMYAGLLLPLLGHGMEEQKRKKLRSLPNNDAALEEPSTLSPD